jgi:uncharacterized protein YyaL (SSP411 family)
VNASGFTNALIHEKSPYLRQHAHNPVNWLPWGEAAFEKARREDKPIFLSVGYSTCHWCHVMAHESFEDESVAEILNRDFVPVKMDREERPDIDRIYMLFVQASTGSGGWPMSVWLTPELKPFFGGTYFPPSGRYGRPGFRELLAHLAQVWKADRAKVELSGNNVAEQLREMAATSAAAHEPDPELLNAAFRQFERMYDKQRGGFGGAPKFPRPVVLHFLQRYSFLENNPDALAMVTHTLQAMAAGGMHDQLGGGFHRYSVDDRWFVPHFEKMLYDQAQLAIAYLEAYQATADEKFASVARDLLGYVLRDLTGPEGGFYSAEDADSPDPDNPAHSGEGSFYIWRQAEIEALLGDDSVLFCNHFGVEPEGNVEQDPHAEFAGRNILFCAASEPASPAVLAGAQKLLAVREKRPRPHLDNKILTAWNGLQISALAKAYRVLGDVRYLHAAQRAVKFVLARMYEPETGQLLRRYCEGDAAVNAFLDDYAFLAQALLDLFEAKPEAWLLKFALDLAKRGLPRFEDQASGGFFSTEADASDVLLRIKDDYDGAEPSGNSVATDLLLRLTHITGEQNFAVQAARSLRAFAAKMKAQPTIAPIMLAALGRWLHPAEQVILRVQEADAESNKLENGYAGKFSPSAVVLTIADECAAELHEAAPFLAGLERHGRITIYECQNFTCQLPKVIE